MEPAFFAEELDPMAPPISNEVELGNVLCGRRSRRVTSAAATC
jgi:hypothetical protein